MSSFRVRIGPPIGTRDLPVIWHVDSFAGTLDGRSRFKPPSQIRKLRPRPRLRA